MKKQFAAVALAGMCLLTACGSTSMKNSMECMTADEASFMENTADWKTDEDDCEEAAEPIENENADDNYIGEAKAEDYKQSDVKAINTQMLVYSCDMSMDVLTFDESVDKLHELITKYNGFIESETYSDGGSASKWQYSDEQKWKTLNTVIRIPSASYDNFCKDAEKVGDLRRKNASVQNLTTEYSDLKTTLRIYQAKEKRYIDLLSEIKSESEAISVENELTEIQIKIAKIKTRMNNIENDVAYSYINLTVNEVREYTEEPVIEKTDTFGQRLHNTISRTWNTFLNFLEGLLFLIIELLPYLLLLGIILFILIKIGKSIKRKKIAAHVTTAPVMMPEPQPAQPETEEKEDESQSD